MTKISFKFSNGDKVKEMISGFEGVITGSVSYLTGCNQYLVTAKSETKNKDSERVWFDEGRLILLKKDKIKKESVLADDNGSDLQAPTK